MKNKKLHVAAFTLNCDLCDFRIFCQFYGNKHHARKQIFFLGCALVFYRSKSLHFTLMSFAEFFLTQKESHSSSRAKLCMYDNSNPKATDVSDFLIILGIFKARLIQLLSCLSLPLPLTSTFPVLCTSLAPRSGKCNLTA